MRVFIDTNVIVSAFLFPNSAPAEALRLVLVSCDGIISDYVIDEMKDVCRRKFPERAPEVHAFLVELVTAVELALTPAPNDELVILRDENDQPILDAAIDKNADILLTGDRDFLEAGLEHPLVLTPRQFIDMMNSR